eukprot:SAG22_NODE_1919_length_3308_cov_9.137738_4_plen_137_part_00
MAEVARQRAAVARLQRVWREWLEVNGPQALKRKWCVQLRCRPPLGHCLHIEIAIIVCSQLLNTCQVAVGHSHSHAIEIPYSLLTAAEQTLVDTCQGRPDRDGQELRDGHADRTGLGTGLRAAAAVGADQGGGGRVR